MTHLTISKHQADTIFNILEYAEDNLFNHVLTAVNEGRAEDAAHEARELVAVCLTIEKLIEG